MDISLRRHAHNPILKPKFWWEQTGVFNPGVALDGKTIHMIYRAQGPDRISRFGYATSSDAFHFAKQGELPAVDIDLDNPQERLGIEDPRLIKNGSTFYITYTCASVYKAEEPPHFAATTKVPWHVRVGLITTSDFKSFKRHGYLLPDIDSRNAVLFPQKVNGKYVLLHRPGRNAFISFSNDISHFSKGELLMAPDHVDWQAKKIGPCSPPILTKFGWLGTFHGVSNDNYYRMGFYLLDQDNPAKVLWRSIEPALSPYKSYERTGNIPNVIFATGFIMKVDIYYIYYGAADHTIAVATINADEMDDYLTRQLHLK